MISPESQVLERHLSLFENRNVLFAGALNDDFPQQLRNKAQSVHCWTWYFDYAENKSAVDFSVDFVPKADLIVYHWTKNKQENQLQLMQLLSQCAPEQEVLIIGENRSGVRSAEKMLSPFGEIGKIDSARRCGLYHFCLKNPPHFDLAKYWKSYQHTQLGDLTIFSLPGIFSAAELDVGTALLLSTLDRPIKGRVLDMGCGAGVIGSYIKQHNPSVNLVMTDIHALAIASAERTLAENQLEADVLASNVFSQIEGKFDLIISNPPFHDGVDTAFRAVSELIQQAKWHLNEGGELRIVANAFLPYADLLDQHFGSHQVLAKTNKFKVYSVHY
ncbi:16S rRNA (guanine(1207)-N(2))-methyltransferase RsmC [Avibacterium gallinarum]|uniref:16S rRNA (guanine(1207)-N(2))-methyltransferase RsmC n=1 Tax=Avibacterium gallinarum TaxID=755 RepID=UPI0039FC6E52